MPQAIRPMQGVNRTRPVIQQQGRIPRTQQTNPAQKNQALTTRVRTNPAKSKGKNPTVTTGKKVNIVV